jgi:hypothetical protein
VTTVFIDDSCVDCGHVRHDGEACAWAQPGDPSGASTGGTPIDATGCSCGNPEIDAASWPDGCGAGYGQTLANLNGSGAESDDSEDEGVLIDEC